MDTTRLRDPAAPVRSSLTLGGVDGRRHRLARVPSTLGPFIDLGAPARYQGLHHQLDGRPLIGLERAVGLRPFRGPLNAVGEIVHPIDQRPAADDLAEAVSHSATPLMVPTAASARS